MSDTLINWLPAIITLVIFSLILWVVNWFFFKRLSGHEHKFPKQLAMVLLVIICLVAMVISLPIADSTKAQVLSLIGLLLSGLLAFSSTTIFGNLMAGIMMRFTEPFRTGDFVRVQGHFGRVTERGLLDCEIQTEDRDLISIPNSMMVNNPIHVVRSSGTIISLTLTLGYDIHHSRIETLLKQAAEATGLQDPFVYVTELGNFAVEYKIGGMLQDIKNLLTTRSNLHKQVLDSLHDDGIEVMSPSVMNQRKLADDGQIIARSPRYKKQHEAASAEDIMFDKADAAEQREQQQISLKDQITAMEQRLADTDGETRNQLKASIEALKLQLKQHVESKPADE